MGFMESLALAFKGGGGKPPIGATNNIGWSQFSTGSYSAQEPPYAYAEQVRDAYLHNAIAQRAVRIAAEGVASAPIIASNDRLVKLVQASSAGQSLIETLAAQMLLHGNGYVQIICDGNGAPQELFALRPDRVKIEPDMQGWPSAFNYRVGDQNRRFAAIDDIGKPQIVHIKTFHPVDDHYGLGCLGAAAKAVAIHNSASGWNRALLDNAARPSGALVYDPGEHGAALTSEQFDRLKSEMEASFAGSNNAGRPMLLEGGLKWQSMSMTPADMDFVALKAAAAREIALAFGVPPMLLGLPGDNTYANYREANRALWRLTLLPLAGKILSALSEALGAYWDGASLSVDLNQISALSEDRERLWAQVSDADFLSRTEKRAMLGLENDDAE